jgi:hypothetical protein
MTIQEAKDFLHSEGYYVGNLWTTQDVRFNFNCTEEEAQSILDLALTNDATMNQVWFAIDMIAIDRGFKSTNE